MRTKGDRSLAREVRAERLSPSDLDRLVREWPLAYLPLGSLEFHGEHLPIGLDALTAHGVCVEAARISGGIVLPPMYAGVGGEHAAYPWTIMMRDDVAIRSQIERTLGGLEEFGVRGALLFTGHFAGEQNTMIDAIAAEWNSVAGRTLHVIATGIDRCPQSPIAPDHAGIFETTLLQALEPDLVHLERLPSIVARPAIDPDGDAMGPHRHDPDHVLWGVFGPDPRASNPNGARALVDTVVAWLVALVRPGTR